MTANENLRVIRDKDYYMKSVKFIRDMVHGYVYLTKFDLELIDTPEFQRLKDIRQLTCQNVYPAARHTRFEHSLGVLELTRKALESLNQNGILIGPLPNGETIFSDELVFNAKLAALLHDVGHCPFSHMGEVEFEKEKVFTYLCELIETCPELNGSSLAKDFKKKKSGSTHEQMSCVVILEKFYSKLSGAGWKDTKDSGSVDFELIIRSIIGLPYDMSTRTLYRENRQKNVVVGLINSKIFDMDKLDYIMRDAISTGIGTPKIDTQRLFNNMYIYREQDYNLVFRHRAVPALQNMVESRDSLYMYVYNHHVTVFSDFMYSYIFRRLAHNAEAFQHLVRDSIPEKAVQAWDEAHVGDGTNDISTSLSNPLVDPITSLGIVPKAYLFSPDAILEQKRSDSDMISLLHDIHYMLSQYGCFSDIEDEQLVTEGLSELACVLRGEIQLQLDCIGVAVEELNIAEPDIERMIANIRRVFTLVDKYQKREFLKPWWKTNFEFKTFIEKFKGSPAYKELSSWICKSDKDNLKGDEFRSQLAKHVIYITSELYRQYDCSHDILEPLEDGDFFVIQRSSRFLDEDAISKLSIALKNNEIIGNHDQYGADDNDYFVGTLTEIFPQRDYYSLYEKDGFYIFSKPLPEGLGTDQQRERHYRLIEEIFIFVAKQLIGEGELVFQDKFVIPTRVEIQENESKSCAELLVAFADFKGFTTNTKESKKGVSRVHKYDYFISHASEDKAMVAEPLAKALEQLGAKVWLDKYELKIGDSLRESIDNGLKNAKQGIVIISPVYFEKFWTQKELNALFAKASKGDKVILPVRHNISANEVSERSMLLADLFSLSTENKSIQEIAQEILNAK